MQTTEPIKTISEEEKKDEEKKDEEKKDCPKEEIITKKCLEPGVSYTKNGKIKRDRYSVYYGYYPKTSSGLTKDDFIKKGKKIMSKKRVELGKKALINLQKK